MEASRNTWAEDFFLGFSAPQKISQSIREDRLENVDASLPKRTWQEKHAQFKNDVLVASMVQIVFTLAAMVGMWAVGIPADLNTAGWIGFWLTGFVLMTGIVQAPRMEDYKDLEGKGWVRIK